MLLERLNKKKTIENVKKTLCEVRSYRNILGNSFEYTVSPVYTLEFSFSEIRKSNQTVVAKQAQTVLCDIFNAINKISDAYYRQIIYDKYIVKRKAKDLYIADKNMYSEREFYRTLDIALLEFSEVYNYGELMIFD